MRHHQDCDVYQATMGREIQDLFGLHGDEEPINPDDYTCYCDEEGDKYHD